MPVNMDPAKKRRRDQPSAATPERQASHDPQHPQSPAFGEETTADREKDLADAEWKNLWDATEVIDMDKV